MNVKILAKETADLIRGIVGKISDRVDVIDQKIDKAIADLEQQTKSGLFNGQDGKDGTRIEPVDLDEFKSYARGTYAFYKGGIVYAFRKTDILDEWLGSLEKHGWTVAMNGIAEVDWQMSDDRTLIAKTVTTNGETKEYHKSIPTPLFKGVWQAGEYKQGDMVTKRGSVWHCNKDTTDSPGTKTDAWTLAVKEGRPGRST